MDKINEKIYCVGIKFFKEFIELYKENKYDYVVLTTRRCFRLFFALYSDAAFMSQLENDDIKILKEVETKIISSQSIGIIGEGFNGKKVLLLDDVMIHGHAVYKIYYTLKEIFGANTIDTLVAIRNAEVLDYYYKKTQKKYFFALMEISVDWRQISNCIVKYLHHRGQCYTSYIYGFKTTMKAAEEALVGLQNIDIDIDALETYTEFQKRPSYLISEMCEQHSFVEMAIIRIYYLPEEECLVVPYVLLKELKKDELNKIWDNLCSVGGVEEKFSRIVTPEDRYKALSAICGITLYKKYFKTIDSYKNVINKSFTPSFLQDVYENFNCQKVFQIIKDVYTPVKVSHEKTLMEHYILRSCKENFVETFTDFTKAYFYNVTEEEESLYRNDVYLENDYSDYMKPIYFSVFFNLVETSKFNNFDKTVAKSQLVFLSDIGWLSYVVKENDNYVGTCIQTGEQSYQLFMNISENAYKAMYVIINHIFKIDQLNVRNELIKKIEDNFVSFGFTEKQLQQLRFFINKKPLDLEDHYFGPLQMRIESEDVAKRNDANIMLNNAIQLMDFCCGGNFII